MDSSDEEWDLSGEEMDPADEEPELPSAVQELIQKLEDKAKPLRRLLRLSSPDLQEFFPEHASLSTIIGWRRKVRLRVLEAFGSCNTFHSLDVDIVFGGDISRLLGWEWEILLRGFRSSTILRAIRVRELRWNSPEEVESLCKELGEILKNSSVEVLTIVNCRLSATCFLNLESGLRESDKSKLESLELHNAWKPGYSDAVHQVVHMINSATRLETLEIGRSGGDMYNMDENDKKILSQALIKNSSLKKLVLNEVKGQASAFLLRAFDARYGNEAIECLHLTFMSGLGDCLGELLRSNPYLKEVTLTAIDLLPEKWHQLGKAISENATARTIRVIHSMDYKDSFTEKGVEDFACGASFDVKVPTVELIITFKNYDALMSALDFVGRVLRGNIKSLESLILILECSCPSGSNHDIKKSKVPMDGNPGETSVLKRLKLFVKSRDTLKGVWKYLLCCLRENTSVTHLDLCNSGLDDEAFRELMGMLQVNLTLQQIDVSRTAWANEGKSAKIEELLKQNQERAAYMSVFREAELTFGDAKAGQLFLCGSPRAGKTRLRRTLMKIIQSSSKVRNFSTKFVEQFVRKSERISDSMQISIWDFVTPQHEIFPQTSNFCIFQFVYSPFCQRTSSIKPDNCFLEELKKCIRFITSHTRYSPPQVLVVMSHKDKVKDKSFTWANTRVDEVTTSFTNVVKLNQEWFHVDAREQKQVLPVKDHIFNILKVFLTENSPRVPHLCSKLTSCLVTQTKKGKCPVWSSKEFHDFCDPILRKFNPTPSVDHSRIIRSIISYMNDVGSIIYIPNVEYIIVDPNWLTHTLLSDLGQHFQAQKTESFDGSSCDTSKDGYVSESVFVRWTEEFLRKQPHGQKGVNREMLENILINLLLCDKLEDTSEYFLACFIPENPSMEKHRPEEGKAEEEDGKDEDGEGENEKEDGEVEDEEDASSSSSSCDEDGEDSFQCIITSFDSKRASMEEQKHKEGAHESMYGQNMDDTSQVVGIRIQSQNEDGEDDGKDEEDDEKDGEGDEKDGEGEDDGKDEEDDGKDGEGDEKDEEGEDDGKGEDEGEDEHGVEGEDEEEDGKDEDEEGGGEDEESIYFSCEEDEDGEGGGKNEEDTSIFFFCEEDDGEDEEDESIFFSCEEDDGERENEEGKDEEEDGEDTSQHVIPSFDSKRASMEKQKHEERGHQSMDWYNRDDNSQFVGIRIQCQDERTMSLTAAFFLRFQMFMRRKLISEIDVSKESVTCSRQYLRLFLDGHQIYVQQGRNHEYVDVLMLCSKRKKELARRYMMKHIVGELISFCASTNGCPGVALVLGVIQTLCVEMLNPSHLREAILIEKLKSDFIRSINDKLEEMTLESSHLVKKEELFNYEHRWAPYESGISERARDLLWQSDVEAVVNCIRQKQIQKLESLQEGLNSVDSDLAQSSWLSQASTMKDYKPSTSKWLSQESTSVENRSTGIVLRLDIHILDMEMQRLEMKEMKIGETLSLQRLEMMEMKMEQILSLQREYLLQQELQTKHSEMTTAMLSAINSEVDKRPRGKNSSYLTREQTIKPAGVSIVSDDAAELATRGMDSEDEEPGLLPSEVDKRPRGKNSSYLTREQTIKAAGVSIVSDDAAELATRGMDSEDEEPGLLPSEVDKRPRGKNSSYLTREQTIKAADVSIVSDDAAELATRGMDSEDEEPGLLPSEVDKRPRGKNSSYLTREQTIKAAGVSIVSDDAAELATRGMDSEDEEPGLLPSEVDKRPRGKNSSYLTREQTIKAADVSIVSDDAAELATRGMDSEDEEPGLLPSEVDKRPRGKNSSYLTREQTIKAAGVSIVSDDAAELATRGMDSEDEEPGLLPSEVDKRPRGKNSSYLTREQTIKAADVSIVSDDAAELATRGMDSEDEEPGLLPSEVDKRPRGKNSSYLTREQTIKAAGVSIVSDDAAELATRGMDSEDEEPGLLPSEVDKRPRGKNSSYLTREQTIKAADVSIVSDDAAELATRGMDSEDEEPGLLPSAVKDLIWRLEGRAQPLPWLSTLSSPEFQEFFPEPASLSTIKGWRGEVRLRVLEAIGSCNTFHSLDVQDIFGGDISRLTASEWELLLRGFRWSTVLRAIRVEGLRWSSLAEVENLCLQLGRILNFSSVKDLRIVNCRLNARCFLNLASGLYDRLSESELESLELRDAWEDSSVVKHMADMIKCATRLETLEIGDSGGRLYDMDEEATTTLSHALMRSWSLKKLVLKEVKDEASAFLLKALNADDGNQTIECLHLISVSGLGDCLREILRSNTYVKEVTLTAFDMRPEEGRQLGEAIRENATARTIRVTHSIRHKDDFKGVEELACAASSTNKDPRMEMIITFYDYNAYMSALNFVVRVLRGNIKSVESLILILECSCPSGSNQDRMESIVPMDGNLGETSVLKRLRLYVDSKDNLKGVWKYLLCCLRENTSVTHLDLCNSGLDDEAFKELMGVLQVNLTLKQIDVSGTSWAIDGKATLIQMALEQNQKRGVYMAVFREARLAFGDAKAGRIFLCGSPLAGKTQLRQTLMGKVQGKSWLKDKFPELFKTTGIQVEFLQNNEDKQISIWDVPGQEIFRTLQNVLFPRTSNFSLFLFVYSTFCEKTSSKPDHCLQSELEDWLNLITSCTRVTGHNLPQVLVVISHKDKATSTSLSWAHDRMEYLTKRFANFVDVLPIQECSYIDARKKNQVVPLKNHIFHIFEKLLSEKSPRVPKLCFQLSSLLVTNTKEHITCPIWTYQRFCDFCAPSLKKLIPSSSAHSVDHSSIIRSIILYLNEVGSIVHIPNLDYIIVNPNWLTNTFLGKVIGLDQKSKYSDRNRSYTSTNGFVSESIFARLIEEFLKKQPHVEKIVDRHVIENILINLDLCFKLEDSSQYFIPSFIPEGSAVESMAWQSRVKSSQFVGIRIQCQDARTMSFTAGFFPCFQMFMRSKLISEMHVPKEIVTCTRHYLCTILDGHEIYVEQGTSYKYVDVLMLCSKYKSRKTALKYVMKHIIQELISFCASPKGCSEVALERGVIQTLCVERLYPSHLRQAILVETLKSDFIHSINDKLEEMPLGSLHLTEEELLSYEHFWPLIEGHTSEYTSERATELLCESDVEAVVNEIRQKQMQRLESLQKGLFSVENDLAQFCKPSTSRRLSGSSKSVENRSTQLISFELDQIRGGLDEILRSSASIELRDGMEMTRGQILSRHQQLQSTLSAFISKVDRIIEYSTALVNTRTPKRPYVTNDVGLFYKMSAHLDNGTIIRLHFMCESVSGFHTVEDQEGLRIRLDSKNRSWIQKIIEISYKVIYYAVKSGLHKTYNLGQAIPDGEDLEPAIVTLDGIDHREFRTGGESKELQEAWLRIQQILAPELENRYSKIFNLYQVKYLNLEVAGHAWVCEKCMIKGRRCGDLTLLGC
ncbi:hypothetical protein MPTK1_2g05030 [Marchantia polymorpha subsp. ruderalis]